MVAVPSTRPVTSPIVFTVATEVLLLLQVPPVVALLNNEVVFRQIEVVPDMGSTVGRAFTVTTVAVEVAEQLLAFVTVTL